MLLPSCVDAQCRYAYSNQPEIGQWNLVMLANALLAGGLLPKEAAEAALMSYSKVGVWTG